MTEEINETLQETPQNSKAEPKRMVYYEFDDPLSTILRPDNIKPSQTIDDMIRFSMNHSQLTSCFYDSRKPNKQENVALFQRAFLIQ